MLPGLTQVLLVGGPSREDEVLGMPSGCPQRCVRRGHLAALCQFGDQNRIADAERQPKGR